jgi:hypothetical protein
VKKFPIDLVLDELEQRATQIHKSAGVQRPLSAAMVREWATEIIAKVTTARGLISPEISTPTPGTPKAEPAPTAKNKGEKS